MKERKASESSPKVETEDSPRVGGKEAESFLLKIDRVCIWIGRGEHNLRVSGRMRGLRQAAV